MEIRKLCDIFTSKGRTAALKRLVEGGGNAVIDGLAGLNAAMQFATIPKLTCPYLIVAGDRAEAGYMYNDALCRAICDVRGVEKE